MPHVFISYVHEDTEIAQRLCKIFQTFDINVWIDREQIKPGSTWKDAIRDAISDGSFYIACFSKAFHERSKCYMNEELTLAIEELRLRPTDQSWFIPVLIDETTVPNRRIGGGETLKSLQWVELYRNWNDGIKRILSVLAPQSAIVYELIQQLKETSARVRIRATDKLGTLGSLAEEAVPSLIQLLDDENDTVRAAAADALGKIGEFSDLVIMKLLKVISKGACYSAKHAIRSLSIIGNRKRYSELGSSTETYVLNHYYDEQYAFYALDQIKNPDPAIITSLVQCLNSSYDDKVCSLATYALKKFNNPSIIPTLMEKLYEGDALFLSRAVELLLQIGTSDVVDNILHVLQQKLYDGDALVFSRAVKLLLQIGNSDVVNNILQVLQQRMHIRSAESESIRAVAAKALGNIGDFSVVSSLLKTLKDDNNIPFDEAGIALLKIGNTETQKAMIPILTKKLKDEDMFVRNRATFFLQTIGSTVAIKPLRESLKNGNMLAAYALANITPPDILGLLDVYSPSPEKVQDLIVRIFCGLGQPAKKVIRELNDNRDSQMSVTASIVLERIDAYEAYSTYSIISTKLPCELCDTLILPRTAQRTGGICMPCYLNRE